MCITVDDVPYHLGQKILTSRRKHDVYLVFEEALNWYDRLSHTKLETKRRDH